ncbi:MAG: tetratricopeptide repeat protein [Chitinispirillales bacterium]|nr:tetratricopeptide repeat protein [Chitinispirillales bacterium]
MLDSFISLIPALRNALLHDREKRIIAVIILLSVSINLFFISTKIAYIVLDIDEPQIEFFQKITSKPRIIKYDGIEKQALYLLLTNSFNDNNIKYAESIVDKIIASDSSDSFALYFSAKIKILRQEYQDAYSILQELKGIEYMPDSVKTLLISVVSDEEFLLMAKDTTLSPMQMAKIGERFIAAKDEKSARIFFEKALKTDSSSAEALYQAARWSMNKKDYKNAEKLLLKLLSIDSLSSRAHGRYAMLLHETDRYRQALAHYKIAIVRDSFDFNLAYNLGDLYFTNLNDNENAKKYFKKAVELEPSRWQSYFKLGIISLESNHLDSAIYYLLSAENYSSDNPRLLYLLATAYEKKNDYTNALKVYDKLCEIDPLNDIALYKRRLLKSK